MIEIKEGTYKKGGVNSEPTTVKPDIEPVGQGIITKEKDKEEMIVNTIEISFEN